MKDALGGTMTIYIIIIMLLLINGYLAFSVNYTKAFRVKNQIISLIEQHEGLSEDAKTKIDSYLNNMNYNVDNSYFSNPEKNGYECFSNKGYCVKRTIAGTAGEETYRGTYYSIITFTNIDIPIINKILPLLPIMQVKGESKLILSSGTNSEIQ